VQGVVTVNKTLMDNKRQWGRAGNVWKNAQIRTLIYILLTPLRWLAGLFRPKRPA
jgi:hypothetical protein